MFRLAVTTSSETFGRMRGPLGNRDIDVEHPRAEEFALDLSTPPAESFDVGFVYPTRLMEGSVVTARHDVSWVNTREDTLILRDKAGVIAALEHAGLPVLRSVCVSSLSDGSGLLDTVESAGLDYPVVVKPNSTTRGVGIVKAHDPGSLPGHAGVPGFVRDFRATGDKSFLIQEWLPEARGYRAMVLDGEVIGTVERRLSDGAHGGERWKHNVHHGAETVGVTLLKSHREPIESVTDGLGVRYLGVNLLKSDRRITVSEADARPTIDDDARCDDDFFDRLAVLVERVAKKS